MFVIIIEAFCNLEEEKTPTFSCLLFNQHFQTKGRTDILSLKIITAKILSLQSQVCKKKPVTGCH